MIDENEDQPFASSAANAAANPLGRLLRLDERRDSLVATISEWVGRGIVEGRLRPGDDLNSVELARRFETSRTPVREALMLLEKEGLVEIPARRRPRVARTTLASIREVYAVRAALHALLFEQLAEDIDDTKLEELRNLVEAMGSAAAEDDLDRYFWRNVAFHERASELAGNPTLQRILDSLGMRVLQLRHRSMSAPHRMRQSIDDHRRLIRALEERDPALAGALMRSIVMGGLAALERDWPEAPDASPTTTNGTRPRG